MQFFLNQTIPAILVLISLLITFKKEDNVRYKLWGLLPGIAGIIFTFCVSYSSQKKSERSDAKTDSINKLYTQLLTYNARSARLIIDSLDTAVNKSRILIRSNNKILEVQNNNLDRLNEQFLLSNKIQSMVLTSSGKLLVQIDSSRMKVQNQLSDENRYVNLFLNVKGNKQYFWILINNFDAPVFLTGIIFTDYDKFAACRSENQNGLLKVDNDCLVKAQHELFRYATTSPPYTITPGAIEMDSIPLNLTPGMHRYEIQYAARNHTFLQQMLIFVTNDIKLVQVSRIIEVPKKPGGKLKIIDKIKSNDPSMNAVDFEKAFPLPLFRLPYKM